MNPNDVLVLRQNRDKRFHRIVLIEAVLVAIVFHMVFSLLFSRKAPGPEREIRVFRSIAFANLADERNQSVKELLDYIDPIRMSAPDPRLGYGSLFADNRSMNSALPEEADLVRWTGKNIAPGKPPEIPASRWIEIRRAGGPEIAQLFQNPIFSDPGRPSVNGAMPAARKFPECRGSEDEIYSILRMSEHIEKRLQDPTGNKPRISKFKMQFTGIGFLPSVIIEESCGIPELDRIAWAAILREHRIIGAKLDSSQPEQRLTVQWEPDP
jgi:hypothetical protein